MCPMEEPGQLHMIDVHSKTFCDATVLQWRCSGKYAPRYRVLLEAVDCDTVLYHHICIIHGVKLTYLVNSTAERLGDRLAEGVHSGFIPQGLQHVIKNDFEVGYQNTKLDFDHNDKCSPEELATIWNKIKEIFLNARDCKDGSRDENAWCDDVVRPLVYLAIYLYGNGKWWFQSVQSQSINPRYLSTIPVPTPTSRLLKSANITCFAYSGDAPPSCHPDADNTERHLAMAPT
ncbi:hypothetical protein K505DRAFT_365232 [Melanomma pulvis-pyrius CBS 109.77]|uniref:PD-(D/E)XK nuclease-like domain-containing protein n=1 Tax=Melanomma pulvis-pyrius CBS 109.77 TaxID=1314802 RepID=A0A6A6X146_9PLEO|nr:hypothetical protein K505DRAFT_365232 [Melanomma pulvis-pyrius CBS 109.77]